METRANFILIGAATLGGLILAMLFALWIGRLEFDRTYAEYTVEFEGPVRGLSSGGEVRFQGIKVGEVRRLQIDPADQSKVLARIRIDGATPVRADSIAQLEPIGLTGVNLIQISSGGKDSPILRPQLGQPPPRIPAEPTEFDKIIASGGDIAERANEALMAAQGVLSAENVKAFSETLKNLERITAALEAQSSLAANTNEAAVALRDASRSFDEASRAFTRLSGEVSREVSGPQGAVANANAALVAVGSAARQTESTLARSEDVAALLAEQSLPDLAVAAGDLRKLSATLDQLALSLDRNPSRFVVGEQKPIVKVRP